MEILGKPSGITLRQHTDNVAAEGNTIKQKFSVSIEKYIRLTNADLLKRLDIAIKYHDEGKKHIKWQMACQADYQSFKDWQAINGGDYEEFCSKKRDIVGRNLMTAKVRHEINSLVRTIPKNFSPPVQVAIGAHHGKLHRKHEKRWLDNTAGVESTKIWNNFIGLNGEYRNHHDFCAVVKRHYEFAGVRSFLQLADRRASAREGKDEPIPFQAFDYTFPKYWKKRAVQEIVEKHSNESLLLLRAPTGAGKTDAALLWASAQIANKKAERLIIAMPTRFTSNALSINIAQNLSNTGLYHSSAWFNRFQEKVESKVMDRREAQKAHELARLLLSPVTVCTIDHLLMALTLTREDHHTILFNLANSCVVIDEADFYDEFTQANIIELLRALNIWQVPILIMSASLPESSLEMYKMTGYPISPIREDISDNDRERCYIQEKREYTSVDELEDLFELCCNEGKAIIYANTIAKAIEFYMWFKKRGINPMLYHSRFTEPDKKEKEKELIEALGKEAWEKGTAHGIAILTQIGEMSVNISADIMISDICPIDRLVQRVGRLCRFSEKRGQLYVVIPQKDSKLYPAPYGNYELKKGWTANRYLEETIKKLECKGYSAKNFVDVINQVYPSFSSFNSKTKNNATLLRSKFVFNWIILPIDETKEDDTDSKEWRSRDIANNQTVFIEFPKHDNFYSWQEFQAYKLENGIDISTYLIKKAITIHKIREKTIKVKSEEVTIYIALNAYEFGIGLYLGEDDNFL